MREVCFSLFILSFPSRTCFHGYDWVSKGRVPSETMNGSSIEVDSLEDLVDVAIDTNNRVIEDTDRNKYVVINDEIVYTYSPPEDT
ncbi:MAG: DUF5305 family protein [Halobacteria archaeon]|nr:DUF5305 family protein [Halobacteria archaeon]